MHDLVQHALRNLLDRPRRHTRHLESERQCRDQNARLRRYKARLGYANLNALVLLREREDIIFYRALCLRG